VHAGEGGVQHFQYPHALDALDADDHALLGVVEDVGVALQRLGRGAGPRRGLLVLVQQPFPIGHGAAQREQSLRLAGQRAQCHQALVGEGGAWGGVGDAQRAQRVVLGGLERHAGVEAHERLTRDGGLSA
jgi:hypothetical protein